VDCRGFVEGERGRVAEALAKALGAVVAVPDRAAFV